MNDQKCRHIQAELDEAKTAIADLIADIHDLYKENYLSYDGYWGNLTADQYLASRRAEDAAAP